MEPTTTRVPAVVDALLAAFGAALPGVQMMDGPPAATDIQPEVVWVAMTPEGGEAITTTVSRAGLGSRRAEDFTIWCLISSLSGDPGMRARRVRAGEMLAAIDLKLREDTTLGGVADQVMLGPEVFWAQAQTKKGPACEVAFQVAGRALL